MSYLLFSQTSTANGTRNTWNSGAVGQTGTTGSTTAAVVNGALVNGVANSAFNEAAIVAGWGSDSTTGPANPTGPVNAIAGYGDGVLLKTGSSALYDLSDMDSSLGGYQFNAALQQAFTASGNVLNAAASQTMDGTANNRTLDNDSGYIGKTLNIGLADVNWNDIKNVEIFLASSETGSAIDTLTLRSFVDARVKIGDTEGCRDATEALNPGTFKLEILDGKRGQVEGAHSDMKLNVTIDVWTNNSGWQNSFSNTGSVFDDVFDINFGSLAVVKGLSEFGLGAGKLVDASDTSFGTDTDQTSAYNGKLTTLLTNMGGGNDLYDATTGVMVVNAGTGTAIATGELETIDYVWGGSGNDVIKGGGNNDFLYGDFGANGGIGQSADPAALSLLIGGGVGAGDGFSNWAVAGVVGRIWQQNLGGGEVTATAANWDQQFQVDLNYGVTGVSGIGVGNHSGAGISNGADGTNPEVNTGPNGDDKLGIEFASNLSGAKIGLNLFYADDRNMSAPVQDTETLVLRLEDNGAEVATYKVTATGVVTFLTGTDGFTVSLADGNDFWGAGNIGASTVHVTAKGSQVFDEIVLSSGGILNGTNGTVSDFIVASVCGTFAAIEGNDMIDGGSGNDRIEGGGDTGALALCGAKDVEKLLNGSLETVATDADLREGGNWYLTAGSPAAGVGFGWTATGGLIEIQKDGTGGLSPFDGIYKLELDSHHQADANPLVQQGFSTCDGAIYTASFAFAERQGEGNGSSDFQLFWDGDLVATFTNPTGSDSWTLIDANATDGVTVAIADAGPTGGWWAATVTGLKGDGNDSLGFKALATQTNTFGTFIDNVSVKSVYDNYGTAGGDTLMGGAGNDVFVYNQGDGVDVILDFAGGDKIDLDVLGNYTRSNVIYDGVLSTLIDSNLDAGAILVRGVANMVNSDFI